MHQQDGWDVVLKMEADDAATTAMRAMFDTIPMHATVVIGEGEMDEAPMLYIGEELGFEMVVLKLISQSIH